MRKGQFVIAHFRDGNWVIMTDPEWDTLVFDSPEDATEYLSQNTFLLTREYVIFEAVAKVMPKMNISVQKVF